MILGHTFMIGTAFLLVLVLLRRFNFPEGAFLYQSLCHGTRLFSDRLIVHILDRMGEEPNYTVKPVPLFLYPSKNNVYAA